MAAHFFGFFMLQRSTMQAGRTGRVFGLFAIFYVEILMNVFSMVLATRTKIVALHAVHEAGLLGDSAIRLSWSWFRNCRCVRQAVATFWRMT